MLGKGRTFRNLRELDLLVDLRCNALGVGLNRSTSDLECEVLDGILDLVRGFLGDRRDLPPKKWTGLSCF